MVSIVVVSVQVKVPLQSVNAKLSSCSILSCAYSAVRAAKCPWFSVVVIEIIAIERMPMDTTSKIASAIISSIKLMPAWLPAVRFCLRFFMVSLIERTRPSSPMPLFRTYELAPWHLRWMKIHASHP